MENIVYKRGLVFNRKDIINLYEDAKWTEYLKDTDTLIKAIENSLEVVTAWDEDNLVGLIRIVGDGLTILYIQDILVLKAYKRQGIGSKLFDSAFNIYPNVRQKVLLTDDSEETRGFYESKGFISCDKGQVVAFARFDK